jgi:hypothetical protein
VLLGLRIKPVLINFRHRFTTRTANSNVLSIRSFLTSLFSLSSGGMHSTLPLEFTPRQADLQGKNLTENAKRCLPRQNTGPYKSTNRYGHAA